jgi:MSHA biogenesis protein MshN
MDGVAMSVINQVLNQLEKRGVRTLSGQLLVRSVPPERDTRKLMIALLVLAMCAVAGALAWQWLSTNKPAAAVQQNAQIKPIVTAAAPVSAAPVSAVAITVPMAVSAVVAAEPQAAMLVPGLQSIPALSAVPPPPVLAAEKNVVASTAVASAKSPHEANKPLPVQSNKPEAVEPGDLPMKQVSPAQHADAEFRKAVELAQQGRFTEAIAGYEAALRLNAGHDAARQALAGLLLESKRGTDAERVLRDGVKNRTEHIGFAMLLARLQVERGAVGESLATLEKSLPYAGQDAEYQAFFAALLQRQNRHEEAVRHYQTALRIVPNKGVWWMGYGISLRALQRNDDAREAFKRALDSQTLSLELQAFVRQKLKGL